MTEDQIDTVCDAIIDLMEADRGLVKSKLRALVQMHVIASWQAPRPASRIMSMEQFYIEKLRSISEERRAHRDDILSIARERAEIAAEAKRRRDAIRGARSC